MTCTSEVPQAIESRNLVAVQNATRMKRDAELLRLSEWPEDISENFHFTRFSLNTFAFYFPAIQWNHSNGICSHLFSFNRINK